MHLCSWILFNFHLIFGYICILMYRIILCILGIALLSVDAHSALLYT